MAEIDTETIRYLGTGALMAVNVGMRSEAEILVEALEAARPDDLYAMTHVGIMQIKLGKLTEAKETLQDRVLKKDPTNSAAKAFLGTVHLMQNEKAAAHDLFRDVIASGDDESAMLVAKEGLNE